MLPVYSEKEEHNRETREGEGDWDESNPKRSVIEDETREWDEGETQADGQGEPR